MICNVEVDGKVSEIVKYDKTNIEDSSGKINEMFRSFVRDILKKVLVIFTALLFHRQ